MLRKRQKQTIKNVNSPYTKADLRKKAHATLQTILKNNPEKLVTASAVICEKIKQLTAYKEIDTLLVY